MAQFVANPAAVKVLLSDPAGGVMRNMAVRGERVKVEAKRLCPRSNGPGPHLADNIVKRFSVVKGQPAIVVGVFGALAKRAGYVINGTDPHRITGNPLLAFDWNGELTIVHYVNHPGTTANNFLAKALPAAAG